MIWHLFFQPFIEYGFMRRALWFAWRSPSAPLRWVYSFSCVG